MMEISPFAAGVPVGIVTLQKVLTHPKVVRLASLLNIDLSNEAQRNAVLSQAESNFAIAAIQAVARPGEGAAVSVAAPRPVITRQYVEKALQAYRETAAL